MTPDGLPADEYNGTEELPMWLEGRKAVGQEPGGGEQLHEGRTKSERQYEGGSYSLGRDELSAERSLSGAPPRSPLGSCEIELRIAVWLDLGPN